MKTSEIIGDAFKFPVSNLKRLIGFGLIVLVYTVLLHTGIWAARHSPLYMFPVSLVSLVAMLFYTGYYLKTVRTSISGEDELPEIKNWKEMFKDGIRVFLAGILYYLIPVVIIIMAAFSVAINNIHNVQNTFSTSTVVLIVLAAFVYMIATFLFVMAQANMAYKGKLEDALALRDVVDTIKKIGVLRYIFFGVIVVLIVGCITFVVFLVDKIPIGGLVVSSIFISSYSAMFRARAFALIYQEGMQKGSQDVDVPEDGSVTSENSGLEGYI